MSEILLHLGLCIIRFFIGLCELFGFLFEADFYLSNGLLSSKTLLVVREKTMRHRGRNQRPRRRLRQESRKG